MSKTPSTTSTMTNTTRATSPTLTITQQEENITKSLVRLKAKEAKLRANMKRIQEEKRRQREKYIVYECYPHEPSEAENLAYELAPCPDEGVEDETTTRVPRSGEAKWVLTERGFVEFHSRKTTIKEALGWVYRLGCGTKEEKFVFNAKDIVDRRKKKAVNPPTQVIEE